MRASPLPCSLSLSRRKSTIAIDAIGTITMATKNSVRRLRKLMRPGGGYPGPHYDRPPGQILRSGDSARAALARRPAAHRPPPPAGRVRVVDERVEIGLNRARCESRRAERMTGTDVVEA